MTLTEIITQLEEARANCKYELHQSSLTELEKIDLLPDYILLQDALSKLTYLRDHGSVQFFNGSITK